MTSRPSSMSIATIRYLSMGQGQRMFVPVFWWLPLLVSSAAYHFEQILLFLYPHTALLLFPKNDILVYWKMYDISRCQQIFLMQTSLLSSVRPCLGTVLFVSLRNADKCMQSTQAHITNSKTTETPLPQCITPLRLYPLQLQSVL